MPKLDLQKAEEIRRRAAAGEKQRALAVEFGVTPPAVSKVVSGAAYPDQPRQAGPGTSAPSIRNPSTADRVLSVLNGRSSALPAREIAEALGLMKTTISPALQGLQRRGLVERVGSGHETGYRLRRAQSVPVAPIGNWPRTLGFRAVWLRQQGHLQDGDASMAAPDQSREDVAS